MLGSNNSYFHILANNSMIMKIKNHDAHTLKHDFQCLQHIKDFSLDCMQGPERKLSL